MKSHVSEKVIKPPLPIPKPEAGELKPLLASFINLKEKYYMKSYIIEINVT